MKLHLLCKRYYTRTDLIHEHFGRLGRAPNVGHWDDLALYGGQTQRSPPAPERGSVDFTLARLPYRPRQ